MWGGVGGHVNVPCASYVLRSLGNVATVYTQRGVVGLGWGGHVVATLLCMNAGQHTTAVSLKRLSTMKSRRPVAILEQLMQHGVLSKTSSPIHCVQTAKIFSCM